MIRQRSDSVSFLSLRNFYRADEATGMALVDPKPKFIALTWRRESGPRIRTQ
jgi:hypothetical protein